MIILLEGPDGSGKDTLRAEFDRLTNYAHVCIVRAFLSNMVYAKYYGRPEWTNKRKLQVLCREFDSFLQLWPVLVLLTAEPEVLDARVLAKGERLEDGPNSVVASAMYRSLSLSARIQLGERVIELDSGRRSARTLARILQRKVEVLKRRS